MQQASVPPGGGERIFKICFIVWNLFPGKDSLFKAAVERLAWE